MSQSHCTTTWGQEPLGRSRDQPDQAALQMYKRACSRSWLAEAWSLVTGRSRCLLDLEAIRVGCTVPSSHFAGAQTVAIRQIRGSVGRCGDFDADFRPLVHHNASRWLNVAAARQKGMALPPVDLIQVGQLYFVQDGHHRISVARARGQKSIEARVTVWVVEGSLPWERQARPGELAPQPA